MIETLRYVNHRNEGIRFGEFPYFLNMNDLRDYEWTIPTTTDEKAVPVIKARSIHVLIIATEDGRAARDELFEIIESDTANNENGRIYTSADFSGYYLEGRITAKKNEDYLDPRYMAIGLTFQPVGVWTREKLYHFGAAEADSNAPMPTWGLDYPYDYPYDYTAGGASRIVNVESISAGDFRIVVFGPAINPSITIGPNTYAVGSAENQLTLTQSEYLVIDSRSKTIVRHHPDGTTESALNYRDKERQFFVLIPPGKSHIVSNVFFDITVYEYRSEPPWM